MSNQTFVRLIPAIYGTIMILIITVIFTRVFTSTWSNLIDQLNSYDYPRTYIELYFLMIIDSFIFLLYSFIFLSECSRRLKHLLNNQLILIIIQLIIYIYSLVKFLVFLEWKIIRNPTSPYHFDLFDYLAVVFIPLFALGGILIWVVFFHFIDITHTNQTTQPERQRLINETRPTRLYTEETEPLVVEGKQISHVF
jgi:hypothetical protein